MLNLVTAAVQLVLIILAFAQAKLAEASPAGLTLVGLNPNNNQSLQDDDEDDDDFSPLTLRLSDTEDDDHIPRKSSLSRSATPTARPTFLTAAPAPHFPSQPPASRPPPSSPPLAMSQSCASASVPSGTR